MLDAALIKECTDPSLKPVVVEQFVQAVGADDPFAVTVKSGGRMILVPKPATAEDAIEIVRKNVEHSVVRVGLTQLPADIGFATESDLKPEFLEPCHNLRVGTGMFAKILRIVARWYGNPTSEEVFPQLFDDAVHAWQTGEFEGENVFRAEDPGGSVIQSDAQASDETGNKREPSAHLSERVAEPDNAGIRIDLTRIRGLE
ncbi:TraH family protein [Rhizobium nepotum]|jgi:hypothetical protein|uniref:TraH family protein n=1 Tax=Rhizobium nepotum TaxID=1035271 RepID=UPI003369C917